MADQNPRLGELLERIHNAYNSFSTVRTAIRTWGDLARMDEAWQRWAGHHAPGSVAGLTSTDGAAEGAQRTGSFESIERVWVRRPAGSRVEQVDPDGNPIDVDVRDGVTAWLWHVGNDAVRRTLAPEDGPSPAGSVGGIRAMMLDPAALLGVLIFSQPMPEPVRLAGRAGISVAATSRDPQQDIIWPGADHYDLTFDAERGALLRAVASMDGAAYAGYELTELAYDEPLDDALFVFTAPSGVRVRTLRPPPRPAAMSVRVVRHPRWQLRWPW